MSATTLLVTGATGCIGRAVVAAALQRGWRVRGLARHRPPDFPLDRDAFVAGDVRDPTAVSAAARGCDAIVHLAGWVHRVPREASEIAELRSSIVAGTHVVARAAAAISARLVYVSSVAVFGRAQDPTAAPIPTTPYGRAKLDAERVAHDVCASTLTLRPVLVYGPHDRGNVARLVRLVERRLGVVVGDGANRKSIVHAGNLADRIIAVGERPELTGVWTAADDPAPTQAELVDEIARALRRRRPQRIPRWPMDLAARAFDRVAGSHWADRVASLSRNTEFSGFALDRTLGYAARVSWREGIRTQVERWISA